MTLLASLLTGLALTTGVMVGGILLAAAIIAAASRLSQRSAGALPAA